MGNRHQRGGGGGGGRGDLSTRDEAGAIDKVKKVLSTLSLFGGR